MLTKKCPIHYRLLHEVFDLLAAMVKDMPNEWRDCQLVLDEMALQAGERFCNSLKKWVGKVTLPTHTGIATKGLVILLAGMRKRWTISVAVYFSNKRSEVKAQKNKNLTGDAYSEIIDSVIAKAHSVRANVVGVTSDMGADNLAFWNS